MNPRLSRRAEADLNEVWLSTALITSSERAADRIFELVWAAIDRLVRFPRLGHHRDDIPDHLLAWNVEDTWTIVYEPRQGTIGVSRILPARRDFHALEETDFPLAER